MTYIEFFEKDAIENICSCLTKPAEHIVLVGDRGRLLNAHKRRYEALLAARGHSVTVHLLKVNRNDLQDIVAQLSRIVEQYEDCVFDLTGGEDLYLVGMGIVYARYPEKNIQMHRFNIRNNTVRDCDQDGKLLYEAEIPGITVEENIRIYGGDVVFEQLRPGTTRRWPQTREFLEDIDRIWEVCRQDPRQWNICIGILAQAEQQGSCSKAGLTTTAPAGVFRDTPHSRRIIDQLVAAGVLTCFHEGERELTIGYKNDDIKKCLTKAGQALEMKIWRLALDAKEKNGSPTYQDALNGVVIDWDGEISAAFATDVENEIDVLMMHGMVPVFVSCKNGQVDMNELYKLHTVATSFGGKYAKKVLVASSLGHSSFREHLCLRAKELDIRIVEDVHEKDDAELLRILRSLWSNS